ncbi:unnamed protein product [Dimorphilus gyrociliatus]|uniref:Uncharacterized protein n=1 Tax=Dimorphilus gyrociliatus TaxID=2664684 RepID=A0A7I8VJI1_9ANNE|nr:unnamed protein product [Dimorphilus gyrociliatus]
MANSNDSTLTKVDSNQYIKHSDYDSGVSSVAELSESLRDGEEPSKVNFGICDSGAESDKEEVEFKRPSVLIPDLKWKKKLSENAQISCIQAEKTDLIIVYQTPEKHCVSVVNFDGESRKTLYTGKSLSCVRLKSGNLYISEDDDSGLMTYSLKKWKKTGNFSQPWGLTSTINDNLIVCDADAGKVFICSEKKPWHIKKTITNKNFKSPWFAYGLKNGGFVITDRWAHKLFIYDSNGNFQNEFGCWGRFKGELRYPAGICEDKDGYILVADYGNNRIIKIDGKGRYIGLLLDKKDNIVQPYSIAIKDNELYVGQGNGSLKCFTYYHNSDYPDL